MGHGTAVMTLLLFLVLLARQGAPLPAFITLPATGVAVARSSQMPCSTLQRRKQATQGLPSCPPKKQPQNAGEHIVLVQSMKKTKVVPVSVAACAMQDHLLRQVPSAPASRPAPPISPLHLQLRLPSMAPAYSLKKSHLPPADAARCCATAAHSLPAVMHAIKDLEVDNPRDEPTLAQR
jgi:hypothetical protein